MAEMREEHFEVVSSNKAREYEKTKKTLNIIRTLLNRYSKRQLIEMIERITMAMRLTACSPFSLPNIQSTL